MADERKGFGIGACECGALSGWVFAVWVLASLRVTAAAQSQTARFDVAAIREIVDGVRVMESSGPQAREPNTTASAFKR